MPDSRPASACSPCSAPQTLTLRRPDDWHLHLRDGQLMAAVVADTARQFGRAMVMPNLLPPVTTTAQACAYRDRILAALAEQTLPAQDTQHPPNHDFQPLMTLYLTDDTPPHEIRQAKESGVVHAVKLYPARATTNAHAGVTDVLKHCGAVLEAMQRHGLPLLVHGEVTDPEVDIFDREAVFIERVMQPLRRTFPALKVVFEHLTTKDGVDFVLSDAGPTAATLTPQHLLYNRNAIFASGIRPHWYCLPVLKRETHRVSLLQAATSGNPKFFLGTDSAPHVRHLKEHACGCAGCYTAAHAMALYATAFEAVGRLHHLEAFASLNGPAFYGLPPNPDTLTLEKTPWNIPATLPLPGGADLVPLAGGQTLAWQIQENDRLVDQAFGDDVFRTLRVGQALPLLPSPR